METFSFHFTSDTIFLRLTVWIFFFNIVSYACGQGKSVRADTAT